ncbi:MAG: hypothetical protein KIS73_29660, partial [Enhydrobacter sp.]|nr:hypothetical protein [Enhydrobacter sp.]
DRDDSRPARELARGRRFLPCHWTVLRRAVSPGGRNERADETYLIVGAASVAGIVLAGSAMARSALARAKVEYTLKNLPFDPSKVKGLSQKLPVTRMTWI